jgi:hypothetical protein
MANLLAIKSSYAFMVPGTPSALNKCLLNDSVGEQMLYDFSENSPNICLAPEAPFLCLELC